MLIPQLGLSTQTALITSWKKKKGERVVKGETLFTMETEKVSIDVPCPDDGYLIEIYAVEGAEVEIGAKVAEIGDEPIRSESTSPQTGKMTTQATEIRTNERERMKKESVLATPRARKLALEKDVDIATVKGTGRDGLVTERDIQNTSPTTSLPPSTAVTQASLPTREEHSSVIEEIPLVGIRGTIASKMTLSASTIPQVTLHRSCNADKLVQMKRMLAVEKAEAKITYDSLFVKMVSNSLREFPQINGVVEDNKIKLIREHNMSIAIAEDYGLVTPVIRSADLLKLEDIAKSLDELIDRANRKALSRSDVQGGTFTVSNLGMYGVDFFTPLVNPPQIAILGIGRITSNPQPRSNQVTLSLTLDHRAIDGHLAAKFLDRICSAVELAQIL